MARALHPSMVKRAFIRDERTGVERLSQLDRERMVAKTEKGDGAADAPPDQRQYIITVLGGV
jgi:hypothetical protein